ncbi:hypothetical protein SPRG_06620 [Saprolegnia parasitica CBS 223.65]|uniref:Uncharacterized protein n=1 Tax=Saprolegnia parasitica (strain CBS 223.65) TaxID=695850 RepID=A0A067CPC3_SAPPC|nr:hypothetical protein SPRG_06620 [Saprolegnia parasitica CBS 223.65]KDO28381.1 hypothetical protein SPRG_06620 [Saprolegnia parasitica CBS 223.65]|eukprot:XP_012200827.1 hypothetical protein SPRG_06620 [Saprolegnia parasitica CBS 223.65]
MVARKRKPAAAPEDVSTTQRPAPLSSDGPLNAARRELKIIAESLEIEGKDPAWGSNDATSILSTELVSALELATTVGGSAIGARATLGQVTAPPLSTADLTIAFCIATTLGADDEAKTMPDINMAVIVATTTSVQNTLLPKALAGASHCATTDAYRCLAHHRLSLLSVDGTPPPCAGFSLLRQAREFAIRAIPRANGKYDPRCHASVLPVVSVAGKASVVTLTKTMDYCCHAIVACQRCDALRSLRQASSLQKSSSS